MYSPQTRKFLVLFLILGWGFTLFFISSKKEKKLYRNNRILIGTFWEVTSPNEKAAKIVFDEAERLEGLLSKYKEGSEVYNLNQKGKLRVSTETFYAIKQAKEYTLKTDGAFDITVGPLLELWGFNSRNFSIPDKNKIQAALKSVGSDKISLDPMKNLVEFKKPGVKIDLGAIAKGYALDSIAVKLKENGIKDCLVNAGGQVLALGDKFGKPWRISLKDPGKEGLSQTLELKNQSASTSADYEQFFEKDGKRYGHIINPKTGYPVETGATKAFTVISESATEADALSTAIFVLGKDKKEELLSKFPNAIIKEY